MNLDRLRSHPIYRHVMIYGLGVSVVQLLRNGRAVAESAGMLAQRPCPHCGGTPTDPPAYTDGDRVNVNGEDVVVHDGHVGPAVVDDMQPTDGAADYVVDDQLVAPTPAPTDQ